MPNFKEGTDPILDIIDRVVRPISLYLGGAALLALGALTITAVGFRYALNSPIFGASDFKQLLLLAVVTFSVAYSGRTGGQVAVEILDSIGGPKITRWTDIIVKLISVVMLAILSWQLVINGIDASDYGEASGSLTIPFGPFFIALACGMALYGIVLIAEICSHIRGFKVSHRQDTLELD